MIEAHPRGIIFVVFDRLCFIRVLVNCYSRDMGHSEDGSSNYTLHVCCVWKPKDREVV